MNASSTPAPTIEQIAQLPTLDLAVVRPEFIDINGHMNIRHYLDLGAGGAELLCRRLGIDDDYRGVRGLGVFTVEHHLRYLWELREGDEVAVHTRVLDRSRSVVHLMSFVVDRTRDRLSSTVEIVLAHVDMQTRRATPFPDDISAGWEQLHLECASLDWAAPVCGVMGVRR